MPRITIELLRKRAEHNEGMISTLEEIALHQEEIEKIEVIGTHCRKLKILYLQNNIISKIEDLNHLKQLEYLNLALNNITKIEGLSNCEFLNKLDLTVNFIDFDTLEESIEHLKHHIHLKEIFLMGNPAKTEWENFDDYVIASLPQLKWIDGREIHRSDRIKANQQYDKNKKTLYELATKKQEELRNQHKTHCLYQDDKKSNDEDVIEVINGEYTDISNNSKNSQSEALDEDYEETSFNQKQNKYIDPNEKTYYTPESRREMYLELAEQKAEQEKKKTENYPKERNYEKEHCQRVKKASEEENGVIRQCNEGKYDFRMDELESPGNVVIHVDLPKHLDASLVSIDAHPNHITIVIKNKVLRLRLPEECNSDAGKAERSKVTGELRIELPKIEQEKGIASALRIRNRMEQEKTLLESTKCPKPIKTKKKMGEMVLEEASKAVRIRGIVKTTLKDNMDQENSRPHLAEIQSTFKNEHNRSSSAKFNLFSEEETPPPLA